MRRSSATEEEAFLHAEACELALLAREHAGCTQRRKPGSVLQTLGVELSVLMGLGDGERVEGLALEAEKHLPDAVQVEQARTVKNPFN
jgi:hypothetical protein